MVKILGACAVGFSAVYMGASFSSELAKRVRAAAGLRDLFLLLRQKLAIGRLPLPMLLREAAEDHAGDYSAFCAAAASALERQRRKSSDKILWDCFRQQAPPGLTEEGRRIARSVFAALGRLDAAQQETALDRAIRELDRLEGSLREDHRRRGRCYWALGICAGLAAAVLLV